MIKKRILAVNLGSSSTKVAYYEEEQCVFQENILHSAEEIKKFPKIWDQFEYRKQAILSWMKEKGLALEELDAVVTRGGHTEPIEGGTYRVTKKMLDQSASEKYGNHATDLGLKIVDDFSKSGPQAFTVDPPVTDEFETQARYSGLPQIKRRSSFHVLNHRAVGKQYAKDVGIPYESLNLIVAHMGGGISVAVHKQGRLIDANNAIDGDGPFSTNRCCSVPVGDLVKMCYSGQYTLTDMKGILNGKSGLIAYTGDSDVKRVSERADAGDQICAEALEAMCYQTAKEISGDAAVVNGRVDAILLTGGIAYSEKIVGMIRKRVEYIAPVIAYPGEYEMQSLALNTLGVLRGEIEAKEM